MFSVKQAAARAGVSAALVYSWVSSGLLAHFRLGAKGRRGKIAIAEADLDALLASLRVEAKGPAVASAPRHAPTPSRAPQRRQRRASSAGFQFLPPKRA
jgi:hypothetical protein